MASPSPRKSILGLPGEPAGDLFGFVHSVKRTNARPEAAALREVLMACAAHPAVAWVFRLNTGAARVGDRFIRFGWIGAPDLIGQLRDGRLLGVEVKARDGRLRDEQAFFLELIRTHHGVAFVARDCGDVRRNLASVCIP